MNPGDITTVLFRLDKQDKVLEEIAKKATETNGRVGKIEQQRAIEQALRERETTEAKEAREEHKGRDTAFWGAIYATAGLAVIYGVLELIHHTALH